MCSNESYRSFGGRRAFHGGPWHGHRHGRHGGWGRGWDHSQRVPFMPLLAAAFMAGAAMRRGGRRFGPRRGGPWGWGEEPSEGYGRRRHEHGGPWGRGWRERHEHGHGHEEGRSMRSEVGALIALLRDAARHGGPSAGQVSQIREVIGDARKRIAAILAETQSPPSML